MSVNEEFLDNQLDKVYEAGFKQSRLLLEGKGANTITSDALYKSKQAILKHFQQKQERAVKQARADQLKKLWNATQHSIVPEGTPPRDMSEELHKMIKELEE